MSLLVIGLVLVSHGGLAQALLETASEIVGPIEPAVAIAVARHQSLEDIETRLREAIARVDSGRGALILADMFGGTASNVALQLIDHAGGSGPRVEVVTGFNLPMLLKASGLLKKEDDLSALAQLLRGYGQKNVLVGSDVLKGRT
jgi:PTS system mannose-specific IIA component